MEYVIKNKVEDKVIFKGNDQEFIKFIGIIQAENGDEWKIFNSFDAKRYIENFCDNLEWYYETPALSQYDLAQEVYNTSRINIVTCGNCGEVLLHRSADEKVKCPYCDFESEQCDFPDLFTV